MGVVRRLGQHLLERAARVVEPTELEQRHAAFVYRGRELGLGAPARRRCGAAPRAARPRSIKRLPLEKRQPRHLLGVAARDVAAAPARVLEADRGAIGRRRQLVDLQIGRRLQRLRRRRATTPAPAPARRAPRPGDRGASARWRDCGAPRPNGAPGGRPPRRRPASPCSRPCRTDRRPDPAIRPRARRPRTAARGNSGAAAAAAARPDPCRAAAPRASSARARSSALGATRGRPVAAPSGRRHQHQARAGDVQLQSSGGP